MYRYRTALLVCSIAILAFKTADDIIEKLGLSAQTAQQHILGNIVGDFRHEPIDVSVTEDDGNDSPSADAQRKQFRIPVADQLPQAASGDKAALAKALCMYVKSYVNSPEFRAAYQQAREAAKPSSEPMQIDITALKASLKELETSLTTMKAHKMPATMIQQMEKGIAQQKQLIAQNSDPTPNKTRWLQQYPEDPSMAVKRRLEEYLKLAATVDFNAATTGKYRKFTNPVYEAKSLKWKAIYRAGKEVNAVTAAFVKQWLQEGIMKN